MTIEWYFRPKSPGEDNREPIYGEFFASDAISDPGTALVREGIQNALDAKISSEPVIVRISVSGASGAVGATSTAELFGGAWEHFSADDNGIHPDILPAPDSPCDYIVFEDFSTCGLEGDQEQAFKPRERTENHFYHFFRAEGQSDKEGSALGSWGVGKHVFLRASRVSTIFGVSVRSSDYTRFAMGKTILKSHWVGDDMCQGGYWGDLPDNESDQLVMPCGDPDTLDRIATTFDLQRGNSPGLSIVIPWPDSEITEHAIVRAVLRDYFYPILEGRLQVIVETPEVKSVLDSDSLLTELRKIDRELADNLRPFVELATWAKNLSIDEIFRLKRPVVSQASKWNEELFYEGQIESIRDAFFSGQQVAIQALTNVVSANGEIEETWFSIYLWHDESRGVSKPIFIREGIIITEVDAKRPRNVCALVIIEDEPLARFLRDAENPSHTEWQHVRLRNLYRHGSKTDLEFVKHSVAALTKILAQSDQDKDIRLLGDFFSLPASEMSDPVTVDEETPSDRPGDDTTEIQDIEPTPQSLRIKKRPGGFSVLRGDEGADLPRYIKIRAAYDVRRGNPLQRYRSTDFNFDAEPIRTELIGASLIYRADNQLLVKPVDDNFVINVEGFDWHRQLYVRAERKDRKDDG